LAALPDTKLHFNEETYSHKSTKDLDVSKLDSVGKDRPVYHSRTAETVTLYHTEKC